MTFKANGKEYNLNSNLRSQVKAGWEEMLNPAKSREFQINIMNYVPAIFKAEKTLFSNGIDLIGKDILEVGCNEGVRTLLMARYEGTKVHGIDVDDYTVAQSPDMNFWNPEDLKFVNTMFSSMRSQVKDKFSSSVNSKVSFETIGMEAYVNPDKHDLIMSWDTIEHIIDLPLAFKQMANALKKGGIAYHEYNPFFAVNGGHSLCTLDFLFGHCRLNKDDFERYIREIRQEEEQIDINFYNKCLNRASQVDVVNYAKDAGFEVLYTNQQSAFEKDKATWKKDIERDVLPDVVKIYPTVTIDDLMSNEVQIILRKT